MADGEQFARSMVAWEGDTVASFPALDIAAYCFNGSSSTVAGAKGELPVDHLRVLEPLVLAGVDG